MPDLCAESLCPFRANTAFAGNDNRPLAAAGQCQIADSVMLAVVSLRGYGGEGGGGEPTVVAHAVCSV